MTASLPLLYAQELAMKFKTLHLKPIIKFPACFTFCLYLTSAGNIVLKRNNMLKKEFVPHEQALALKELGFDEPCFKKYIAGCLWSNPTTPEIYENIHSNSSDCLAPLYQQAFRWFREKYNLHSYIVDSKSYKWYFNIDDMTIDDVISEVLYFKTFEEAELECLKKLIEIVKNKG